MYKSIKTNKGTFKIRYVYDNDGVNTLVLNTCMTPEIMFEGKHGDEIPLTEEYRNKYKATLLK